MALLSHSSHSVVYNALGCLINISNEKLFYQKEVDKAFLEHMNTIQRNEEETYLLSLKVFCNIFNYYKNEQKDISCFEFTLKKIELEYKEVGELIARHRKREGVMFDECFPHKPKASEHEVEGSSNRAQVVRFRPCPSDRLERTPLRYISDFKQPRFPEEQQLVTPPGGRIQPFQSTSS